MSTETMTATRRDELIAFLDGSGTLDGVWFGEKHPTERGAFWWREELALLRGEAAPEGCSDERPCIPCFTDKGQCDDAAQGEQQAVATIESVDGRSHIHLTWHTPWGELKAGDRLYTRPQPAAVAVAVDAVRALADEWRKSENPISQTHAALLDAALSAAPAAPAPVGLYRCTVCDDSYRVGTPCDCKGQPAPVAGDVPRMLILGRAYTTRGGAVVKMVSIHNAGTDHETMACAEGVHRYTRRLDPLNFGRVTCTNVTDPRDLILPTPIAQDRASQAGAVGVPDGAIDALWTTGPGVTLIFRSLETAARYISEVNEAMKLQQDAAAPTPAAEAEAR